MNETSMSYLSRALKAHNIRHDLNPEHNEIQISVDAADIWIQARPHYCNRGRFLVTVDSKDVAALSIDNADGFPRYYFGTQACASELYRWMRARGILPVPECQRERSP